ncbi:MAG TPA: dihydrodipicolinate synthase family protein, partial [Chitinophaga sp.]|uniref:dihydrodipicolinate synthase family protein n=1 Tax=Chitinophaga sp. TaxID=1869181 RepID=UPI002F95D90D
HIPVITGMGIDMLEFLRLAEGKIPNLAGIKYTAATLHEYQACLNYKNGRFDILYGYDELLLPALAVGAQAAIGSTYTFAAPLYLKVMAYFREGKIAEAQQMQLHAINMIRCLSRYSPIPTQKTIMKLMGTNLGPCRLPLVSLSAQQEQEIGKYLEEIKFVEVLKNVTSNA